MVLIVETEFSSPHLKVINDWFSSEWGADDYMKTERDSNAIPAPIIAFYDDDLVGGLAFTRYVNPQNSGDIALWVNALFVPAQFRGQAIASELITASTNKALSLKFTQIFALTNVPNLYVKRGWEIIGTEGDDKVVMWQVDTNG
ncbi:MAG: GNAT family N-acetyltransferase [Hyphomicrobiales bacterium]